MYDEHLFMLFLLVSSAPPGDAYLREDRHVASEFVQRDFARLHPVPTNSPPDQMDRLRSRFCLLNLAKRIYYYFRIWGQHAVDNLRDISIYDDRLKKRTKNFVKMICISAKC